MGREGPDLGGVVVLELAPSGMRARAREGLGVYMCERQSAVDVSDAGRYPGRVARY